MEDNIIALPFCYNITTVAIAISGTSQISLTMANDSVFELHNILASSSLDLVSDFTSNNFSVLIQDQGSGRYLANSRIMQRILCGPSNGSISERRLVQFAPGTIINFDFLNLSGSTVNTVNLTLKGYKLFSSGAPVKK